MNIQRKKRNWLGRRGLMRKGRKISIVRIQLSRFVINHGDLLGYVIIYVKLLKNKTDIYIYQIKKVLYHAEEIGISLGTGLSRAARTGGHPCRSSARRA